MFTELEKKLLDGALGVALQSLNRSQAKSALVEVKQAYAKHALLLTDLRLKLATMEVVKEKIR